MIAINAIATKFALKPPSCYCANTDAALIHMQRQKHMGRQLQLVIGLSMHACDEDLADENCRHPTGGC